MSYDKSIKKICTDSTVVIDADFLPYQASGVHKYQNISEQDALSIIDSTINSIYVNSKCNRCLLVVSSPKPDFRKQKYPDYKENRKDVERPELYPIAKQYLLTRYNPLIVENVEADDVCCSFHQQYNGVVLCSPDKDLLQSSGIHYDIKSKRLISVSEIGDLQLEKKGKRKVLYSTGEYKLWHQMIKGDSVDNIPGLPRYGDVSAYNLLNKYNTREDLKRIVINEYYKVYGESYREEFEKTYCLVKMRYDLSLPDLNAICNSTYK